MSERKCIRCQKPLPEGATKKHCPSCAKIINQRAKERRERLKAEGRCTKCGNPLDAASKVSCSKCLEYYKNALREIRERKKEDHLCIYCGKPLTESKEGNLACDNCNYKAKLYARENKINRMKPFYREDGALYSNENITKARFRKMFDMCESEEEVKFMVEKLSTYITDLKEEFLPTP